MPCRTLPASLCMTEGLPSLWDLLRKRSLAIKDVEALVPIVHRYRLTSLPVLDAILVRLYTICQTAEEEERVDRLVIALGNNVAAW